MLEMYVAIWRVDPRRQSILILLSVAVAAMAAVPLGYQKAIINELTHDKISADKLVGLCSAMMALIIVSLALKNCKIDEENDAIDYYSRSYME